VLEKAWEDGQIDTVGFVLQGMPGGRTPSTWATPPVAEKLPVTSGGMAQDVSPWPCSVPWAKLCALIEPHYPKLGNGRPPVGKTDRGRPPSRSENSILKITTDATAVVMRDAESRSRSKTVRLSSSLAQAR